jgi:hypothetical protein
MSGAEQQQVIGVFIEATGEAGRRGGELMPKPPFISFVGRRFFRASQQKILHFKGAALLFAQMIHCMLNHHTD